MAKWYKQYTNEYLNADFRNAFSNSNHGNSDSKSKVISNEDTDFLIANGLLAMLKQKIAENLDLSKAVLERGRYLTTTKMDRSMFEEVTKCRDWKLINRILGKLKASGSNISFVENGDIIEIDMPDTLKELDNYTLKKLKEKIKNGEVDESLLSGQPTDTLGLDNKTGELLTGEEIKSYEHKDLNLNDSDNDLTEEQSKRRMLIKHRREILQATGKSEDEINNMIKDEFYDDVPF